MQTENTLPLRHTLKASWGMNEIRQKCKSWHNVSEQLCIMLKNIRLISVGQSIESRAIDQHLVHEPVP